MEERPQSHLPNFGLTCRTHTDEGDAVTRACPCRDGSTADPRGSTDQLIESCGSHFHSDRSVGLHFRRPRARNWVTTRWCGNILCRRGQSRHLHVECTVPQEALGGAAQSGQSEFDPSSS